MGFADQSYFNEAIHVKYHDAAIGPAIALGTTLLVYFSACTYMTLHRLEEKIALLPIFSVVSGVAIGRIMDKYTHSFCERRADIEGLYATQCSVCLQEMAVNYDKPRTGGYLWKPEMESIAQELARNNMRCADHKENF